MDLYIDGTGTTVFDRASKKKVAVFASRSEATRYLKSSELACSVRELTLALASRSHEEKLEAAIAAATVLEEAGIPIDAALTEAINQLGSHERSTIEERVATENPDRPEAAARGRSRGKRAPQ